MAATMAMAAGCGGGTSAPAPEEPHTHYRCEDLQVTAYFNEAGVRLEISGESVSLPRASAASGARYADAEGREFWTRDSALLTLPGQPRRQCTTLPE
jgi:membrane-bound inhibitor of C-type lysozyme